MIVHPQRRELGREGGHLALGKSDALAFTAGREAIEYQPELDRHAIPLSGVSETTVVRSSPRGTGVRQRRAESPIDRRGEAH
jgi:hypothetical protein